MVPSCLACRVLALLALGGCAKSATAVRAPMSPESSAPIAPPAGAIAPRDDRVARTAVVLVSNSTETYCDGNRMDSDGYRKTLTKDKAVTLAAMPVSDADKVKSIAIAATRGLCQDVMKTLDFRVERGDVRIPPIQGWAGIAIIMCTCKPEVEVNVLRVSGVSKVTWEEIE